MRAAISPAGVCKALVSMLLTLAWPSAAPADYMLVYDKFVAWEFPRGANVAGVQGTAIFISGAVAIDATGIDSSFDGAIVRWPVDMGLQPPVFPTDVEARVAAAEAVSGTVIQAGPLIPGLPAPTINVNVGGAVAGRTDPDVRFAFATSFASGTVIIAGATIVAADAVLDGGIPIPLPIPPGTKFFGFGLGGSTLTGVGYHDPITATLLDLDTGVERIQDVFSLTVSANNGEFSVDPVTGDLFIGAFGGDALFEYRIMPDGTTRRFGRAEVSGGILTLEGELATLTWTPGTSTSGIPGYFLAAGQIPDFRFNLVFNDVIPGHTYSLSLTTSGRVEGAEGVAIPEPSALTLFGLGTLGVAARGWGRRTRSA